MTVLYYLIPALIVFRVFNHFRVANHILRYENMFIHLRNTLIRTAKERKINTKSEGYIVVDDLLEKSSESLKYLNLWIFTYEMIRSRNSPPDPKLEELQKEIDELGLQDIYDDTANTAVRYMLNKSVTMYWIKKGYNFYAIIKNQFASTNNSFKSNFFNRYKERLISRELNLKC